MFRIITRTELINDRVKHNIFGIEGEKLTRKFCNRCSDEQLVEGTGLKVFDKGRFY